MNPLTDATVSARQADEETMRAAVLEGPGRLKIREGTIRPPGRGEVRIRIDGCGLCGSDLPLWEGRPWFSYPADPGAPGHEAWGRVESVGPGVEHLAPGTQVAGLFHNAFAEMGITRAEHVMPIPDGHGDTPFVGEPLACAANAVRRSHLRPDDLVVVVGVGFIGAAIIGIAKAAGAEVHAVSRRPYAQEIARSMGADKVYGLAPDEVEKKLAEATEGELADVVFEVTGRQGPLDLAARLTRIRGTLVIAGYHQDDRRSVDMQLWNWRGLDVVNAHEREPQVYMEGMREAAALIGDKVVDFAPLYTHSYALDELDEAFRMMAERPDGFLKAVVCP